MPTRRAKYYETTNTAPQSVSHVTDYETSRRHFQQNSQRSRYAPLQSMWPPRRRRFSAVEVLQEQTSPVPRTAGHKSQKIWSRCAVVTIFLVTLNRRMKRKTTGQANSKGLLAARQLRMCRTRRQYRAVELDRDHAWKEPNSTLMPRRPKQ